MRNRDRGIPHQLCQKSGQSQPLPVTTASQHPRVGARNLQGRTFLNSSQGHAYPPPQEIRSSSCSRRREKTIVATQVPSPQRTQQNTHTLSHCTAYMTTTGQTSLQGGFQVTHVQLASLSSLFHKPSEDFAGIFAVLRGGRRTHCSGEQGIRFRGGYTVTDCKLCPRYFSTSTHSRQQHQEHQQNHLPSTSITASMRRRCGTIFCFFFLLLFSASTWTSSVLLTSTSTTLQPSPSPSPQHLCKLSRHHTKEKQTPRRSSCEWRLLELFHERVRTQTQHLQRHDTRWCCCGFPLACACVCGEGRRTHSELPFSRVTSL